MTPPGAESAVEDFPAAFALFFALLGVGRAGDSPEPFAAITPSILYRIASELGCVYLPLAA